MIELEIYAAGVRNPDKVLELDRALDSFPGLRYKVDGNHDIVYFEADEASFTLLEILTAFERNGLTPKVVGQLPEALSRPKKKTQPLR